MIYGALVLLARALLRLRYQIRVEGLEAIASRGTRSIVFLPNHPALVDPVLVMSVLARRFRPRALADRDQVDRFFIRWVTRVFGVRPMSSLAHHGMVARREVERVVGECIDGLRAGENLLLYPGGQAKRQSREDLGGNSAVETILDEVPEARVVLVRIQGLWGSRFSWASGREPDFARALVAGTGTLVASGIVFSPRRQVSIELVEPEDLPRKADRRTLNRHLEGFYNREIEPNLYVPYTPWDRSGRRELPQPVPRRAGERTGRVPAETRRIVADHLRELAGASGIRDQDRLAHDLGLDSLARAELAVWVEQEFGFPQPGPGALDTVADVLLAACGEASVAGPVAIEPPERIWFAPRPGGPRVALPEGGTIPAVFLATARANVATAVVTDQASGVKTYRQLLTAVLALRPNLARLPGNHVGIMLPASVAAGTVLITLQLAGKTPVMVNWTTGQRNLLHALELLAVERVLTARKLVAKLEAEGTDFGPVRERFVFLEDLASGLGFGRKLRAALAARLGARALDRAPVSETAAVLFTSGSESLPKAVPLRHANILANLRDVLAVVTLTRDDRFLAMLPAFHSFGLAVTTLLPLLTALRACYHPNPTEAATLARLIEAHRLTLAIGTPTFLAGIARAAEPRELASLRLAITGAEKCPPRVYEMLAEKCPNLVVLEGYGLSECSPIVAVNDEKAPRPGTIGKMLPSYEHALVAVDETAGAASAEMRRSATGEPGMLLVRGPSVFAGYLNHPGPSPFVEFEGRTWFRTGDIVVADEDGVLTFSGRLQRFVKLGGEMISLPAIEEILEERFASTGDEGPTLAVVPTAAETNPELVLFTTRGVTREQANRALREAGLSPLHNLRRVVGVDALPLLGTGKTDYRALAARLAEDGALGAS